MQSQLYTFKRKYPDLLFSVRVKNSINTENEDSRSVIMPGEEDSKLGDLITHMNTKKNKHISSLSKSVGDSIKKDNKQEKNVRFELPDCDSESINSSTLSHDDNPESVGVRLASLQQSKNTEESHYWWTEGNDEYTALEHGKDYSLKTRAKSNKQIKRSNSFQILKSWSSREDAELSSITHLHNHRLQESNNLHNSTFCSQGNLLFEELELNKSAGTKTGKEQLPKHRRISTLNLLIFVIALLLAANLYYLKGAPAREVIFSVSTFSRTIQWFNFLYQAYGESHTKKVAQSFEEELLYQQKVCDQQISELLTTKENEIQMLRVELNKLKQSKA